MITQVVNIRRAKYDIYIGRGRGSIFGNPFRIGRDGDRNKAITKYRDYFYKRLATDPDFKKAVLALKGKVLG